MPLTDMARTKSELDTDEISMDHDKYPWGLRINLDEDDLKKLGIDEMPKVGSEIKLEAVVHVTSVSEREELDSDVDRSVSLQITEMGLSSGSKDASDKLYGD